MARVRIMCAGLGDAYGYIYVYILAQFSSSWGSRPPNQRWRRATGVTYAMICLLLDTGWQPSGPWDWISDTGERFCVPDEAWESDEELD